MRESFRAAAWTPPRVRRFLEALDLPATGRFVAITVAIAWFGTFILWRSDYRFFDFLCNHDPGAALRTDEVISQGARPGTDFFYIYGLLPVFVSHVFFGIFGRTPPSFLALLFVISCFSYAGLTWTISAFRPTRLGALLIAVGAGQASWQITPTYAMETAVLVWAVALRIRGRNTAAVALATVALFVKMSMAAVIVAELAGLVVLDALRTRRGRPLLALLAIPIVAATAAGLCIAWLGVPALVASFDVHAGATVYRAYNLGFLREGRVFWHPAGHNLGWYLGSIAGPWCLASIALVFLAIRAAARLLRATIDGSTRGPVLVSEEARAISGFANLAFIVGFFGPALYGAYYYAWLLLVGVAPSIAQARLRVEAREGATVAAWAAGFGWLSLGAILLLSQKVAVGQFMAFVRDRRVLVGPVTMEPDDADELKATLALGHSIGRGSIAAIARVANFGLVDPTIREGHYWMLPMGAPKTKAVDETIDLAESADAIFVTKFDYPELTPIPELKEILETSERLHEGKRFLLLRPRPRTEAH